MLKIAHIDDSKADQMIFLNRVQGIDGISVCSFISVSGFLASGCDFDLVFSDLNVPPFWGVEVIDEIASDRYAIMALSGLGGNDDVMGDIYRRAGADGFLSKDDAFDHGELRACIEKFKRETKNTKRSVS